jgi:hypothetical protein
MAIAGDSLYAEILRQAAKDAEPILEGGPFTLPITPTASRVDWRSVLNGSPLSVNEVAAGAFVPRRLFTRNAGLIFADQLPTWLGRELGRTILLVADAGEGKTTFLNFLAVHMAKHFVLLRWQPPAPYDLERLLRFQESVRRRLPKELQESLGPLDPPLLVLGDLDSGLDASSADLIAGSFALRQSEPDASVVLLAGRRSQLKLLEHRLDAEVVGLAAIEQHDAEKLCSLLHQAHATLSAIMTADELTSRYPNLLAFLRWPREAQVELLTQSDAQLLASLLQAVYGQRFYYRLIQEYKQLETQPADQVAYLHVCLATAAGAPLPDSLLLALAPGADLDKRAKQDPWVLDGNGMHSARHGTIAQVVLEESGANVRLSQCLGQWAQLFLVDRDAALIFEKILYQAGNWELTAPERTGPFKGELRQRVRTVLSGVDDLAERIKERCGTDLHRLLRWGAILQAFIPAGTKESKHLFLIEIRKTLLDRALALAPESDSAIQHRIAYYLGKVNRDRDRIIGRETLENTEDRMSRWMEYEGEQWCGPDFYTDLFWEALSVAESLTIGPLAGQDEERIIRAYRATAVSFERLRGFSEGIEYDDPRNVKYTRLINRYIHHALPVPARLRILREVWQRSQRLDQPNVLLGMVYAELLFDAGGGNEDAGISEARAVLHVILNAAPDRMDALLLLALLSREDPKARAQARRYLPDHLDSGSSGFTLAFAEHAGALLQDEKDDALTHLRTAINLYATHVTTRKGWESVGEYWQVACSELAKLGATPPSGCTDALRRARSKWD